MNPAELKAARNALGLTQSGLAAILRMRGENAPDTVRKWERGVLDVPGYAIVIIDVALNIPGVSLRLGISKSQNAAAS